MLPEALIVCSQEESARCLLPVLAELGTKVERHHDAMAALTRLWAWRYDAVIVDCEGGGDEAEVLREVREVGQNRNAVTIAIIGENEDPDDAYALGAHFVLQKPLTSFKVRRMLKVAHALVTQERRRYARHDCDGPVTVLEGGRERAGGLVNLSAGGVAIQMQTSKPVGVENSNASANVIGLGFRLPGTPHTITPRGEIVYQKGGRLGIRFTEVNQVDRVRLDRWVAQQHTEVESHAATEALPTSLSR